MAQINWRRMTRIFTPADYTADDSAVELFNVSAGDLVGPVICRTIEVFNGSGTDAIFALGDDGDVDRYVIAGDLEETSTSAATSWIRATGGSGSGYALLGTHLYTAANTIDVGFTANTAGTRTTGKVEVTVFVARMRG